MAGKENIIPVISIDKKETGEKKKGRKFPLLTVLGVHFMVLHYYDLHILTALLLTVGFKI